MQIVKDVPCHIEPKEKFHLFSSFLWFSYSELIKFASSHSCYLLL